MNVQRSTLLVTGAAGGLGTALIQSALARGAGKIYAGSRDISALQIKDSRVIPIRLDVTSTEEIKAALLIASDIDILINNAGLNRQQSFLTGKQDQAAAEEMSVNYFGTLEMCRMFAPVLTKRRGAIVNILSILARVTLPAMGSLCASKAAALRLTETIRAELSQDNVHVMAVLPGVIDTLMSRDFPGPKASPFSIAEAIFDGLNSSTSTLYPDPMAQDIAQRLVEDRQAVSNEFAAFI
ncbi:SDR family oxidoreductase [Pseudomonas tolaasii]|uniref:SDR family oxidoreductase n=1 Tax=Pseudomonas tolaasii TaxID=29442 RepID=UPI001C5F7995|nr:SDR family oxidoreductase [Pseudomonas tolaasii]MBW4793224.1 SDR family oxidoreductase [Pseudomonas tolaasii]